MKIKFKITIIFSLFLLVSLMSIGFLSSLRIRGMVGQELENHLVSVVTSKAHHVESFLDNQKNRIEMMASSEVFKKVLLVNSETLKTDKAVACQRMSKLSQNQDDIYDLFILNSQGQVVCSNREELAGEDFSNDLFFKNGIKRTFVGNFQFDEKLQKRIFFLSSPLKNSQPENSGVMVVKVDTSAIEGILQDKFGMGDTGEIYIINKDGFFMTPLLFRENTFLKEKDNSVNAQKCLDYFKDTEDGFFIKHDQVEDYSFKTYEYDDYRKEQVVGVHHPSHQKKWCVIAQMGRDEIYSISKDVSVFFVHLSLVFLLFFVTITFLIARKISQPVEQLTLGVKNIKKTGLKALQTIKSKDEFGELSKSFNDMLVSLKKARSEVDQKVKEQTEKIIKNNQNITDQQKAILNILEDVDEEKIKAEGLADDLEKFKLAVDNASDHIVITDSDGNVIYANRAVTKITGFEADEVIGKKAGSKDNWGGQMEPDFYKKMWKAIKEKKEFFGGEIENIRKNGEKYMALASISPVLNKEGEVVFFVGIERDITEEKKIDQAKTEFVSLASHQLRTPLSAINWYAEMLLAGDAGKLSKEQQDFIQEIYQGNQRMVDLVNALLNVSRLELGTFMIESKQINLVEILETVIKEMKPMIKEKKIVLSEKIDQKLTKYRGDEKLLRIVFQNLLSNACKYTPEKGNVTVTLEKKGKNILYSVKDTGIGIPESQQNKIFAKLFRADNVKQTDTEGTGLGLYILKSIAESSGGQAWFTSIEKKGSTFFVELPASGMKKRDGTKGLENVK